MVKTFAIAPIATTINSTANTTQYWGFAVGYNTSTVNATVETSKQVLWRTPGTISNLYIRLSANSIAATTTFTLRKNAADTSFVISVGSSATGHFQDNTNPQTIAAGDKLCIKSVPGASTGTFQWRGLGANFKADTDTVSKIACRDGQTWSTASTTTFFGFGGLSNATESNVKHQMRKVGSFKNMNVNVRSNARTTATTVRLRKNGADGNQVVSITASTAGFFEDTTNSDTIAGGNDFNYSMVTGTGTGNLIFDHVAIDFISTANYGMILGTNLRTITEPLTRNFSLGGVFQESATEGDTQVYANEVFQFSELSCLITTNAITAASTLTFRENTANTALTLSIGSSATGVFSDITNTVTVAASTSLVNTQLITPSVGGTPSLIIANVLVWTWLAGGAAITKSLATETVSASESIARRNTKLRPISTQTTSISESGTRLATKQRPIAAQTVTLTEVSLVRIKGKVKSLATETVTIGESLARLLAKTRAINQTVTISESAVRLKAAMRSIATQTVAISENVVKLVARARFGVPFAETVAIGETLARLKTSSRSLPETVSKAETLTRIKAGARLLSDSKSITEQLARIKSSLRTIPQTVSLSASAPSRLAAKIRTLATQTVTISESVAIETLGEIARQITQTVDIAEQVVRLVTKSRVPSVQTVAITESVAATKIREVIRALATQTVAISENIARLAAKQRILTQTVTIPENLIRLTAKARIIPTQIITFSDSVTSQTNVIIKHIVRTLTDTVLVLEQLLYVTDKWRSRYRRITDPSNKKVRSNHPAFLIGSKGPAHDGYIEF